MRNLRLSRPLLGSRFKSPSRRRSRIGSKGRSADCGAGRRRSSKRFSLAQCALKPTQVVEVLDRGPYREIFDINPPTDTGLISRHNTVIELHGRRKSYSAEGKGQNHHFAAVDRFRLEGLMFHAPDLTDFEDHSNTLMMGLAGDLVIENCLFRGGKPGMTGVVVYSEDKARRARRLQ